MDTTNTDTSLRSLVRSPGMRPVIRASITLGFAVGVFAISFGVAAVAAGASGAQACVMSLLVFTGASQFSAVSVIAGGGSVGSAVGGALLLSARNGVYGLAMSQHAGGSLPSRLVAAQLTIDESTAMALAQEDEPSRRAAFWITGLSVYLFWNLGTLLGVLLGNAVDLKRFGLDAALPAAFVAMVWPHLQSRIGRISAGLGGLICLGLIPFVPVGVPILCASLAVLVGVPAPRAATPDVEVST